MDVNCYYRKCHNVKGYKVIDVKHVEYYGVELLS